MMSCKYCDFIDYTGEYIHPDKVIDGKGQNFEVYLLDNIESENYNLFVNGTHTEIEIEINYCPMCGEKL
jgi:phage protein U